MSLDNKYKIELMNLFVSKTNELRSSSYLKFVSKNQLSVSLNAKVNEDNMIIVTHPDEDAIKSMILTLRLFIQDKDRISIRNIEGYMKDLGFNKDLIGKYERGRKNLNDFLDSIDVIYNNEALTYRKIIEVFFYGNFAHVDQKQYAIYKTWKSDNIFFEFKKNSLLGALNNIVKFLFFFEDSIRLELERISL